MKKNIYFLCAIIIMTSVMLFLYVKYNELVHYSGKISYQNLEIDNISEIEHGYKSLFYMLFIIPIAFGTLFVVKLFLTYKSEHTKDVKNMKIISVLVPFIVDKIDNYIRTTELNKLIFMYKNEKISINYNNEVEEVKIKLDFFQLRNLLEDIIKTKYNKYITLLFENNNIVLLKK